MKPRRSGWGGAVFLKPDPGVFTLRSLAEMGSIEAPDGALSGEDGAPVSGRDRIVPVPVGTEVFNAQKRDCALACRHRGPACLEACATDKHTQLEPLPDGRLLVAAGGECGGGEGERHVVNLKTVPFRTVENAVAFMDSLGYPYRLMEDDSKTTQTVYFVVKMDEKTAQELIKRQTRKSPYNISAREEVFRAKWRHLQRRGSDLVITRTLKGYPTAHEVVREKGRDRLKPVPLGPRLVIPGPRVVKADLTHFLRLPDDAFILEDGVRPGSMWFEPFPPGVPIFYLLLLGFIVFNLLAMRAYFRG